MSKENILKEFIRTKLSEAGMSSKFRKAVEEYKEVSLKLQDLFADRAKALEGYKKAEGGEKEKYKMELSRIQKLVNPLQDQMEKAERVFNKALLSEPEELEEGSDDDAYTLKALTGHQIGQDTAAEFLSNHNVNLEKLKKAVVQRVIDKYELKDVIMGKAHKLVTKNFIKDYVKEGNDDGLERVAAGLPQTEEELEEGLNPASGEWVLFKTMGSFSKPSVKKKFVSVQKSHRSAQIAMKKALDKMNRSGEDGGYGIVSKDKWDKEDSRFKVESVSEGKYDKEIKALEDKIKAVKGKTPADLGLKAVMGDDLAKLKAMNEESINEENTTFNKWLLQYVDRYLKGKTFSPGSPKYQWAFSTLFQHALTDANFHAEAKKVSSLFKKAEEPDNASQLDDLLRDKGADVARKAKWDGHDIIDGFAYVSAMRNGGPTLQPIKALKNESVNEVNINEASRRANEMFGETKFGQEIHKMLKGKWDAKKVEDYLDGLGGGSTQKNLRIIDFISKAAGMNPRKYDNQTLGKQISDLVDKLEVLYKDFTKGTDVKKFDDVHIKSKNLTGIVYVISGNTLVVKTASGMVKTTKDDVEAVMSDGVITDESINEGVSVFDERHYGKKGIIIMIDDNGKKTSAIFKDKKNADKYNRNNPEDVKKLLKLAKSKPFGKAIDESINEGNAFGMAVTQAKKEGKKEFEFNGKTYKVKKGKGKVNVNESVKLTPYKRYTINGKDYTYHGVNKAGSHIFRKGDNSWVIDDDKLKSQTIKPLKESVNENDCGCGSKAVVNEAVNVRKLLQMNVARELKVSPSSIEVGVGNYGSRTANDGSQVVVIGLDANVKKISIPQADYFDTTVDYGGYLIVKADGKTGKLLKVLDRVKSQNDIRMTDYIKEVNEAVKEPEVITKIRDIVKKHQHASIKDPKLGKSVKVDAFSASAIIQVYDTINDANKEKFAAMSIHQMATVAYKLMKK